MKFFVLLGKMNLMKSKDSLISIQSLAAPWNQTIETLTLNHCMLGIHDELARLGLSDFGRRMNAGQYSQVFDTLINWDISIYWLVKKKWLKKLKIPAQRWRAKAFEPHGELLKQELELCSGSHMLLADYVPYSSASEWFKEVITETKAVQIKAIDRPPLNFELPPGKVEKGKKDLSIERERRIINFIAEGGNPFNRDTPSQQHRFLLVEAMNNLSSRYDGFDKEYKKPYLRAWRAWLRQRATSVFQYTWIEVRESKEGNQLYQRCISMPGRGRGKMVF